MANKGCAICGAEDAVRLDPEKLDICPDCLYASAEGCVVCGTTDEGALNGRIVCIACARVLRDTRFEEE